MAFDPDEYLSQSGGFDPDAYLAGPSAPAQKAVPTAKAEKQSTALADIARNVLNPMGAVKDSQFAKDAGAGFLRGAGSIGATLMYPLDKGLDLYHGDRDPNLTGLVTGQQPISRNQERRQAMTAGLGDMGADTGSLAFAGGKLGGEVAGTAGAGPALAGVSKSLGAAPALVNALKSGGFSLGRPGAATLAGKAGDMALRVIGGAATGGASAGLVDPSQAGTGALLGGALPPAIKLAGAVGGVTKNAANSLSEKLLYSALKPTKAMHQKGEARRAVQTILDEGINVSRGGLNKLESKFDDVNQMISGLLKNSTATVDKSKVLTALDGTRQNFMRDVSPQGALNQIDDVALGFQNHPIATGQQIPVQLAQDLKRGTYQTLKKSYGEMKGAETEARKALARGLKEEIATAVPGLAELNKRDADLITAMKVLENRVMMDANKNPGGLGLLAPNKAALLAFLADRSATIKGLLSRGINSTANSGVTIPRGLLTSTPVIASQPD